MGSARGPGLLLVSATGLAAAAVATDAAFDLPAALRAVLFAGWAVAVGVLGWVSVGRAGRTREAWAVGGAAVAAFGLIVLCVPGATRVGRLAPPWGSPTGPRLRVTTGDPVVARGSGVTVACVWVGVERPRLEVRTAGEPTTVEPTEGPPGVLSARLAGVVADTEYRFVAGPTATAWHRVTAADPARLTDAAGVRTSPPGYAAGRFPDDSRPVGEPVRGLIGGRVELKLPTERPATLTAVWLPDVGDATPATVAGDTASTEVTSGGKLVATLTTPEGLTTVVEQAVQGVPDSPPAFVAVDGLDAGRWPVRPGETLRLAVEVSEDYWSPPPTLELRLGPTRHRIPLTGTGGRFAGTLTVPLAGDKLAVQLWLADARHPDGVTFPVDRAEFVRADHAAPLAEQLVIAQRDRVGTRLAAAAELYALDLPTAAQDVVSAVARSVELVDAYSGFAEQLRAAGPDLAPLRERNTRLATERLDRLRLSELTTDLRRASAADAGRLRERLAAVVAGSPRLTAARQSADRQMLAATAAVAGQLATRLIAAADQLDRDRAERLRPTADRLDGLKLPALRPAVAHLRAGRPVAALAPLDAVARQLAADATDLAAAADARRDPREAARQLAKLKLPTSHPAVAELLAITRPHSPSADTPERVAAEFPSPAELKRSAVLVVRDELNRLPSSLPALAERLEGLPPPADTREARLIAALARRADGDPAWVGELRWRLDRLARTLNDERLPLPPAVRVGFPPSADEAAVRERLDGCMTDRRRLTLITQWWNGKSDRDRDAALLVETVPGGGATRAEAVRLLRSGGKAGDAAAALNRLRDALGPDDLPRVEGWPAAERLVALTAPGLASRRAASVAGWQAYAVRLLAGRVAELAAERESPADREAVRSQLVELADCFRLLPGDAAKQADAARTAFDTPADRGERLRKVADALRRAAAHAPTSVERTDDDDLGRRLVAADELLRAGELRRAATVVESALR